MKMYLILMNRVILGVDGFLNDRLLGSQFRIWFFGLCYYKAWGDEDPKGNLATFELNFPKKYNIL